MAKIHQIICLDFETGGLNCQKNPATSVAYQAFNLSDYKDILEFSTYIQPYANLETEQSALNYSNTTYEQIASGINYKDVVKRMEEDFSLANSNGSKCKPILLGHNIPFDIGFLCYMFKLAKSDISKYLDCKKDCFGNEVPTYIDTTTLSRMKWGNDLEMANFKLSTCIDKAGMELHDAHNAMNDVRGTKGLFLYLTDNMRINQPESQKSEHNRFRNHFQF